MGFPVELKYTSEHEWIRIEGDIAYIGVTDYAQEALGDVVFLEIPEVGSEIEKGETFGVVESVKAVSDLYAPLSGEVTKANEVLVDTPELINEHPYDDGWMIAIKMSDTEELKELMNADDYETYIEENG
ncbi:MAG: glycine cleavage system protein GcvH [Proteobacteria bacterium]|nr:glycine cleavage system protein GcvH [Pseudomonadota bacterium]